MTWSYIWLEMIDSGASSHMKGCRLSKRACLPSSPAARDHAEGFRRAVGHDSGGVCIINKQILSAPRGLCFRSLGTLSSPVPLKGSVWGWRWGEVLLPPPTSHVVVARVVDPPLWNIQRSKVQVNLKWLPDWSGVYEIRCWWGHLVIHQGNFSSSALLISYYYLS